jgi:dTDP-4-dehydrorhamnose 3,5-epimerase
MIFTETALPGVWIVEPERISDDRGFFGRIWCREEFEAHGIPVDMVQASLSFTRSAGTLRGLHFSWPPSMEAKLVRCVRGRIFDVIVDLRPDSPAYCSHVSMILDEEGRKALFIPPGFAHGFQTLVGDSEVLYMMSDFYRPDLADGVRYDDPEFGIAWPLAVTSILARDRDYPDFSRAEHGVKYSQARKSGQAQDGVVDP